MTRGLGRSLAISWRSWLPYAIVCIHRTSCAKLVPVAWWEWLGQWKSTGCFLFCLVIITSLWTLEIASNCRKLEVHENGNVECFALHEMQSIPVGSRRYFWRQWFVQLSVIGLLVWPYMRTWDVFYVFGEMHIPLRIWMSICSTMWFIFVRRYRRKLKTLKIT